MSKDQETIVRGTVTEALPNLMFRISLEEKNSNGESEIMTAYLSGKMKMYRIKVLVGDTVEVVVDPYGGKGRVVKRM